MALYTFPRSLMRDRTWGWNLSGHSIGGGRAMSGVLNVGRSDGGGLWVCTASEVQVSTPDHVRTWRALRSLLDGGATPFVMEARDVYVAPWPKVAGAPVVSADSTTDDLVGTDDDALYEGETISCTLAVDAALRATTVRLQFAGSAYSALRGGERFSLTHATFLDRLYEIATVSDLGAGLYDVGIRPPLREATTSGARADFDHPRCVMQLASPDTMDLAQTRREFGQGSLKLVEAFGNLLDA